MKAVCDKKTRRYFDDVPEPAKEQSSKVWGERKRETYAVAKKRGIRIEQGDSFNKVVIFELHPGYYHLASDIVSTKDISRSDVGSLCGGLISKMVDEEIGKNFTPLFASNVCDWDSGYAREIGTNTAMRDSVINACIASNILLTGGETANLGDQINKTGMSWMFTLLSKYNGNPSERTKYLDDTEMHLNRTLDYIVDKNSFGIAYADDMPLIHIKETSKFLMTADGSGSKSIVCNRIGRRTDIYDTLAMCCDDATREGAFPVAASIGVHADGLDGKPQIIDNMVDAGSKHFIPLMGCVFHESKDVRDYIMNGVALSKAMKNSAHTSSKIKPGLGLVLLYEEQRSNGITTQRKILEETFGEKWYGVKASYAFKFLNDKLHEGYSGLEFRNEERTLGELVARPSTPYFRIDSMMPQELMKKICFRINVSSGGLIGKTRRLLETLGLGANYSNVFEAPKLILLLQMASRLEGSKGMLPDEVAYYTWGCGNGAVIGTADPSSIRDYYVSKGIPAKIGGIVTPRPEISVASRCIDSTLKKQPYILVHRYIDKPLG